MGRQYRPTVYSKSEIIALHKSGLNQCEVARRLGCTPGYVNRVCRDAGIKVSKQGRNPRSHKDAEKVLDYIISNGGSLRNAMMATDLKVCDTTVRSIAKKLGVDIQQYRYFQQKRRNWVVHRPGYRKTTKVHNDVPVQCTECGHEMEMNYQDFRKASPCKCPSCGAH